MTSLYVHGKDSCRSYLALELSITQISTVVVCALLLWHPYRLESDDVVMARAVRTARRVRRWRSVADKRQIVKLTSEPSASVALIARAHELNANQAFNWRRTFERCEVVDFAAASAASLPVNGLTRRSEQPGSGDPVAIAGPWQALAGRRAPGATVNNTLQGA